MSGGSRHMESGWKWIVDLHCLEKRSQPAENIYVFMTNKYIKIVS